MENKLENYLRNCKHRWHNDISSLCAKSIRIFWTPKLIQYIIAWHWFPACQSASHLFELYNNHNKWLRILHRKLWLAFKRTSTWALIAITNRLGPLCNNSILPQRREKKTTIHTHKVHTVSTASNSEPNSVHRLYSVSVDAFDNIQIDSEYLLCTLCVYCVRCAMASFELLHRTNKCEYHYQLLFRGPFRSPIIHKEYWLFWMRFKNLRIIYSMTFKCSKMDWNELKWNINAM